MGNLIDIGFLPQWYKGILYKSTASLERLTGFSRGYLYRVISAEPRINTIDELMRFLQYLEKMRNAPWKGIIDISVSRYAFLGMDNLDKSKFPQTYKGVRYLSIEHVSYQTGILTSTCISKYKEYGNVPKMLDALDKISNEKRGIISSRGGQ